MVDILPKPTDHAADKDNVELWIYVDGDDSVTHALIDSSWDNDIGFRIHWHIGTRLITHGDGFSEIWQISSNAGFYLGFADDYEVTTPSWDYIIRESFRNLPSDRIAVGYLSDPLVPEGSMTVMVGYYGVGEPGRSFRSASFPLLVWG